MDDAPELSVRDGYLPPGNLPRGECILTRLDDGSLHIDRADPHVMISAELLAQVVAEPHPCATLTMADGPNGTPFFAGALLKIDGVNRTVIYRIVEYVPAVRGYIAEWPD